jgi:hypothetical protein
VTAPAVVRRGQGAPARVGRPANEGGAPVGCRGGERGEPIHCRGGEASERIERRRGEASARRAARDQLAGLRRTAPLAAVLLTAVAAHAGLAPHLAVGGLEPDLLLVAVAAVGAGRGSRAGAAFGFAAGLGADLFLATPLGTSALAFTVVGHMIGGSSRPRRAGSAAALCSPISPCFACRTDRRHAVAPDDALSARPARQRRRAAAGRAAIRRSVLLTFLAVAAGRLGTAVVATVLGGIPFSRPAGLLHMLGVAVVSAPLGIPAVAASRRPGRSTGVRR